MKSTLASAVAFAATALASAAKPSSLLTPNGYAGVILPKGSSATNISNAHSTITVPEIGIPLDADPHGEYAGQIAIGLDGVNCAATFQAGFQFFYTNGSTEYGLFYQWYPEQIKLINNFGIAPGDQISIGVSAAKTSGTVDFQNVKTGKTVSVTAKNQPAICGDSAFFALTGFKNTSLPGFGSIYLEDTYGVVYNSGYYMALAPDLGTVHNITITKGRLVYEAAVSEAANITLTYYYGQ